MFLSRHGKTTPQSQTRQSIVILLLPRHLPVRHDRLHIRGFTINFLNGLTSPRLLQITRKRPLTNTPILHWTIIGPAVVARTRHLLRTPIRLSGDLTKIKSVGGGGGQIDANVVRARIVDSIDAGSVASVAGLGHAGGAARLEGLVVEVYVGGGGGGGGVDAQEREDGLEPDEHDCYVRLVRFKNFESDNGMEESSCWMAWGNLTTFLLEMVP